MRYVLTALCALLCAGMGAFLWFSYRTPGDTTSAAYLTERIAQVGGAAAYTEFSRELQTLPAAKRHDLAHVFGGALYTVEGIEGVRVCDAQFSFGCYHEVTGRAINEHGLEAINAIHEACAAAQADNVLACQHGLGHGIVAHFGYAEENLYQSLDTCKHLEGVSVVGGCYGGVFMEYNTRTMWGTEAEPRPMTNVLDPCLAIFSDARRACAYYLPQWWQALLHDQAVTERYVIAGARCDSLPEQALHRSCIAGLGSVVVVDAESVDAAASLCEAATQRDSDYQECVSSAAASFAIERSKEEGMALCAHLPTPARSYCGAYMEQQSMQVQGLDAPAVAP